MGWIEDNKDEGPWDFLEQSVKAIYNQGDLISVSGNPVWSNDHVGSRIGKDTVTDTHFPGCGYWPDKLTYGSGAGGDVPPTVAGTLYSTGENDYGNLALNDSHVDRKIFTQVSATRLWNSLDCGAAFVAAIKDDGTLWTAGQNTYGQLGLGDTTERHSLTQVGTSTWIWVTCLNHTMLAVNADGTLWGTGFNNNGELGLGVGAGNKNTLTQIGSDSDWIKVDGGQHFVVATKFDGAIYGTGRNTDGELGLGDRVTRYYFTHISSQNWATISCGGYHTMGIRDDGTLWATGVANSGQLGLGAGAVAANRVLTLTQVGSSSDWNSIGAGYYHSVGTKSDGTLHGTGLNFYGELGLGHNDLRDVFNQASGSLWKSVTAGYYASYAIYDDDKVYAAGLNANGDLGINSNVDSNIYDATAAAGGITLTAQIVRGGNHFAFILTN